MTTRARFLAGVFTITLAAPLALSSTAFAQEACGDAECPEGYECKSVPAPCDGACTPEGECPPCEPETTEYCAPLPCTSDADCASDMVCHSEDVTECTGGAAPCARPEDGREAECPPPEEPECTTTSVSQCVPRYLLPCTAAADCGAGFTCEEIEQCSCEGSAGSPNPDDPGSEPVPEDTEPNCTCEPTGEFTCRVIPTACSSDADCEPGWACIDIPDACSSDSDGNADCELADPARLCAPPHYELIDRGRGEGRGLGEEDGNTSTPSSGSGSDNSADEDSAAQSSSGCAITHTRSPNGLASILAGIVLALAARRKRFRA